MVMRARKRKIHLAASTGGVLLAVTKEL